MPTYTLIASNTVGAGGVASVTFSSIPATYTDLVIKISARTTFAQVYDWANIRFNGSTTGFTGRILYGDGATAAASVSAANGPIINGNNATANTFGNSEVYIPNYTSANFKSLSSDGANETNNSTAYLSLNADLWSNTAAITSVNITPNSGSSLTQYSTFTLYGISNA